MMFLSTIRATVLLLALPTLPPKYGWLIIGFTPYQHQVSLSYSIISIKYLSISYICHNPTIIQFLPIIYPICPYIIQSPNK